MYALSHVFRLFPRRTFVGFWYERTTGSLTSIQRQGENAKSCADHMDKEVANRRWDMWPPFVGHGWLQTWKLSALLKTVFHLQFVKCRKSFSYKYYQVLIYLYVYIHTYIYIYVYTWTGSEHPSPTLTLLKLVWPHLKHPALCETEATTGCASTENRKDD